MQLSHFSWVINSSPTQCRVHSKSKNRYPSLPWVAHTPLTPLPNHLPGQQSQRNATSQSTMQLRTALSMEKLSPASTVQYRQLDVWPPGECFWEGEASNESVLHLLFRLLKSRAHTTFWIAPRGSNKDFWPLFPWTLHYSCKLDIEEYFQ